MRSDSLHYIIVELAAYLKVELNACCYLSSKWYFITYEWRWNERRVRTINAKTTQVKSSQCFQRAARQKSSTEKCVSCVLVSNKILYKNIRPHALVDVWNDKRKFLWFQRLGPREEMNGSILWFPHVLWWTICVLSWTQCRKKNIISIALLKMFPTGAKKIRAKHKGKFNLFRYT